MGYGMCRDAWSSCPFLAQLLAIVGGIVIYIVIGFIVGYLITLLYRKEYSELDDSAQTIVIVGGIFWFISLAVIVIYWAMMLISLPFIAVTRNDLKQTERRIVRKIEEREADEEVERQVEEIEETEKKVKAVKKFKVGDVITGIKGNPDGYEHLYEGCKCKVLSINDKGRMKLLLIDHKDRDAQRNYIGEIFKAPSRNFVLLKKKAKKKVKKK